MPQRDFSEPLCIPIDKDAFTGKKTYDLVFFFSFFPFAHNPSLINVSLEKSFSQSREHYSK